MSEQNNRLILLKELANWRLGFFNVFENGIYYIQFTNHQQQFSSKIIVDR